MEEKKLIESIEKIREYDNSLRSDIIKITKTLMALGEWNDDYKYVKSYYDVTYGQIQAVEKILKILSDE